MGAILKKIRLLEDFVIEDTRHPIVMYFSNNMNEKELYPYRTTLKNQFCNEDEFQNGLLESQVNAKLKYANSQIGRLFDITLYKFKVAEITDGLFVALVNYDSYDFDRIYYYSRASYLSREDLLLSLKYRICLGGLNGTYKGVTSYGKEKRIDHTLVLETDDFGYISAEQDLRYRFFGEHPFESIIKDKIKELDKKYSEKYNGKIKIKMIE